MTTVFFNSYTWPGGDTTSTTLDNLSLKNYDTNIIDRICYSTPKIDQNPKSHSS